MSKEHKNIVDYSLKYFRCLHHQEQNLISNSFNCHKNLCIFFEKQHENYDIINLSNLIQEIDQNKENIEKLKKLKN